MAVHQRTPAEIAQDIGDTSAMSPLQIALDLQQKNQSNSFTNQPMSSCEARQLDVVLQRLLEFEERHRRISTQQVAYQQRRRHDDPEFKQNKRVKDSDRALNRYQNDDEYRKKILQRQRELYAQKKQRNFNDDQIF